MTAPNMPDSPLGLIAGEGAFPFLVARGARAQGRKVVCAALQGCADPALADEVDSFRTVGVARMSAWIRFLGRHGVTDAIMVGRVRKSHLHSRMWWLTFLPDLRTLSLYFRRVRRDKRDHAVLLAIADELASAGIQLMDSTRYTPEHLATPGVMGTVQPTPAQLADADFGLPLARLISTHDIGQSLAIVDKDVLAVEAVEGTDRMIERAGQFCKGRHWTLIKVANANRDLRFDVPTVGTTTLHNLHKAGCRCLVLEAKQTILLEKPAVLKLADQLGIAVVGR
jgi:UDP-2,3-diacylglucosamine hydrolase